MTYAEMIAMPDYEESSELGNDEENSVVSTDGTATPTSHPSKPQQPSPASTVHNININYSHSYLIARKNGDEIDIPTLLQSLSQHTMLQSPSTALAATKVLTETVDENAKQKRRKLILDNVAKPLIFTSLDISDPPHLRYSDDMDSLIKDWDDSSYLIIKGVPIPLKYWSQVYRWARPGAWDVLKNNWSNRKVTSFLPFF